MSDPGEDHPGEASAAPVDAIDYVALSRATYAAQGYDDYRWVHQSEPPPFTEPTRPLSSSRVALVASGGVYAVGQVAFHHRDDTSYRRIPRDVDVADLRTTHFAYDLTDARRDVNAVFPIEALRELEAEGTIGELAPEALTFMGGIYSSRRVREELAPALGEALVAQEVDVVLLVPV